MENRPLTKKQKDFADYFIQTGNGTKAAELAGYSKKTAKVIASENLTKPNIKKYITEHLNDLASKRIATQEEVLEYLTLVMRGEVGGGSLKGIGEGAQVVIDDMPPTVAERTKAAELLGKRYGTFKERVEVEDVTPVFVDDIGGSDDD